MARPVGTTNRPQFYTYTSEVERKEFVKWVIKNYKKDPQLAKWYGDQLFGKAMQPVGNGPDGKEFPAPITNVFRDVSNQEDHTAQEEN